MSTKEPITFQTAALSSALVLNVPDSFKDPEFSAWLNNAQPKLTWHKRGTPASEWSDVVLLVDPSYNGEGADSDMPERFWNVIVNACATHIPCPYDQSVMVRLTNLV